MKRPMFEDMDPVLALIFKVSMAALVTMFVLACALAITGCHAGCLDPEAVGPAIERVSDRHDAYVEEDKALTEDERESYLLTTEILRSTVREAKANQETE
jgi:hypothetical protein